MNEMYLSENTLLTEGVFIYYLSFNFSTIYSAKVSCTFDASSGDRFKQLGLVRFPHPRINITFFPLLVVIYPSLCLNEIFLSFIFLLPLITSKNLSFVSSLYVSN